jgi:hypothetical protein
VAKGKYQEWLEPDGLTRLEGWARDGLTDEQIAHNCGITTTTLYDWKNKYPAISEALKRGKDVIDIEVENALLKRALGYRYDEVTREKTTDKETGFSCLTVTKRVTKEVLPDTTAQIFWLKNRRPDKWRDRIETVSAGAQSAEDDPITKSLKEAADAVKKAD